jgi:C-terminal processing protease CtpA/Prc
MVSKEKQRASILKTIKKLVLSQHINVAGVDYNAWAKGVDERTPELLAADLPGFETGIRQLLAELKTSHTGFYPSIPRETLPQHTINASFQEIQQDKRPRWMFLDVFEGGPAYAGGIIPGDILDTVDGNACLPPATPQFRIGAAQTLRINSGGGSGKKEVVITIPELKGTKQRPPMVEPKSPLHAVMGPGLGLLKTPYFPGAFGMAFGNALDKGISDLKRQGCNRLVIDLRGSIGGSLGFAHLASYLCPGQIAIGHSLTPRRLRNGYEPEGLPRVRMPRSTAELVTTLARFSLRDKSLMLLTEGLGQQPFHNRIVVLVNEWTNSAAEMVANFAAENRLACIVGQKTRGNVLGAANFGVGSGYWLRLPVFGWFTSKGQTIEGKGVEPDVPVDITPEALAAREDDQMKRAIEIINDL